MGMWRKTEAAVIPLSRRGLLTQDAVQTAWRCESSHPHQFKII
jgi:hypothetical protein